MVKKTKPTGIRFDLEQLDFFKSKNPNLITPQQAVNYLLNNYFTEHKLIPELIRSNPIYAQNGREVVNYGQPLTNGLSSVKPETSKVNFITRSAEQWHELKRACESQEEWMKVKEQILNDPNLPDKTKSLIINTP